MNPIPAMAIVLLLFSGCAVPGGASSAGEPSPRTQNGGGCPVTVPQPGFVPPEPYPTEPPLQQRWYGTAELWTLLDSEGQVWDLPIAEDGHVGDKTLWFSENFSTAKGEDFSGDDRISIRSVRLDRSAPDAVQRGGVPSFNPGIKNFLLVPLELPKPGCWEVTASYQGAELTYVLEVMAPE